MLVLVVAGCSPLQKGIPGFTNESKLSGGIDDTSARL